MLLYATYTGHVLATYWASDDLQSAIFLVDWCFHSENNVPPRTPHVLGRVLAQAFMPTGNSSDNINVTEIVQLYCLDAGLYNLYTSKNAIENNSNRYDKVEAFYWNSESIMHGDRMGDLLLSWAFHKISLDRSRERYL